MQSASFRPSRLLRLAALVGLLALGACDRESATPMARATSAVLRSATWRRTMASRSLVGRDRSASQVSMGLRWCGLRGAIHGDSTEQAAFVAVTAQPSPSFVQRRRVDPTPG